MFPKNGVLIILCNLFLRLTFLKTARHNAIFSFFNVQLNLFTNIKLHSPHQCNAVYKLCNLKLYFFRLIKLIVKLFSPFFAKKTLLQCLINRLIESNSMQSNYWHSQFHSIYFQRLRWDLKRDKNIFENAIQEKYGQCGFFKISLAIPISIYEKLEFRRNLSEILRYNHFKKKGSI